MFELTLNPALALSVGNWISPSNLTITGIVAFILKFVWKRIQNRITDEEKHLLLAAHSTGVLHILRTDIFGPWVRAGQNRDFFENQNPAFNAKYLEALHRLVSRGFASPESSDFFRLTGSGFAAAEKVCKNRKFRRELAERG